MVTDNWIILHFREMRLRDRGTFPLCAGRRMGSLERVHCYSEQ